MGRATVNREQSQEIYKRIKITCIEQDMSLLALAEQSKLPLQTISKWKTNTPSFRSLKKIASVLDVDYRYLLNGYSERQEWIGRFARLQAENRRLKDENQKLRKSIQWLAMAGLSED